MSCSRCGQLVGLGARFCPACGAAIPATVLGDAGPGSGRQQPVLAYGAAQPVPQTANGLAIAGMVLGILWVYWVGSILALVFGYVARGQIAASAGRQGGGGMAMAAIVLGWVGVGTLCLLLTSVALHLF
jgi:hypothetical protein